LYIIIFKYIYISKENPVEFPPNKKQKINLNDGTQVDMIGDLNKDVKIEKDSQSFSTNEEASTSSITGINTSKDSSIISNNNIIKIETDKNNNQNKINEIPSTLKHDNKSEILQHPIVNPILSKNESIDVNLNTPEKLPLNNPNQITPSNNYVIQNISSISSNNNNTAVNGITYIKSMPLSTPPANINIQTIPKVQEPSPLQVQTNGQPLIIQHNQKSSIITPSATPVNSPILKDPLNQINHQLINTIKMQKRNSLPIANKISSLNQLIPQNTTTSLNNLHNPQGIFPSNLNVYQRTKSYPIQQSPHLSIQNQISSLNSDKLNQPSQVIQIASPLTVNNNPLINPQIQILSTSNQIQPSVNLTDNSNFQFQSNVAVQGQGILNIHSSENIPLQISKNSLTHDTSSISPNFGPPNYFKQINNVSQLTPPIQVLQQPLPSNVITQNIINPQIQKSTNPPNNPNSTNNPNNNIIYYYQ